jgi:hypothetical protein
MRRLPEPMLRWTALLDNLGKLPVNFCPLMLDVRGANDGDARKLRDPENADVLELDIREDMPELDSREPENDRELLPYSLAVAIWVTPATQIATPNERFSNA